MNSGTQEHSRATIVGLVAIVALLNVMPIASRRPPPRPPPR
jgi:hypothetical protein